MLHFVKLKFIRFVSVILFYLLRAFPLQNKVVATTMRGRKYGDNPQFIFEDLHKKDPKLDFVWLVNDDYHVTLPNWIRRVSYSSLTFRSIFELATAKVWINTHRFESYWEKRKGQLVIETWHGGLGLKKIELDVPRVANTPWEVKEIQHTCSISDVFISQSDHLSSIYRRAFGFKGKIWKIGYPKNDCMFYNRDNDKESVKSQLGIPNCNVLLYAPTMREGDQGSMHPNMKPYTIDWNLLYNTLISKFGGEWVILVKWHPVLALTINHDFIDNSHVIDVTSYNDMQKLIKSADIMLSDYSSCIFDAALLDIPCFTFATDFDAYKAERGVYYEMSELPFPYATNNDELVSNITHFNNDDYSLKWQAFKRRTGLYETGHAASDIADKIIHFVETGSVEWV